MVGEVGSYFGKGDLFPLCVTVFQIETLLRVLPYFVGGDKVSSLLNFRCKIEIQRAVLLGRIATQESKRLS